MVTGVADDALRKILDKLEGLGLITFGAPSPAPAQPRAPAAPMRPLRPATPPRINTPVPQPAVVPQPLATAKYDPKLLDEDVDLEMPVRQRVLDLFHRLEGLDHYSVLGVPQSADKKAVKRAYFEYAAAFHPDKYFRKRLGAFKLKMETIFGRATQAHDVLTDKAKRAEYDSYLLDQQRSRGIEDMLKDVLSQMAAAEEAVRKAVPESVPPAAFAEAPTAPGIAPPEKAPTIATPVPKPRPSVPPPDMQARRDALARRLTGNRAPPARTASGSSPAVPKAGSAPHASTGDAMAALRKRYEDRVASARGFQAKKYSDNAAEALAANDPIAAANALRVAVTMSPNDAQLKRQYEDAQAASDSILAETYSRQASYEEKNESWADAARSWSRVVGARPNEAHCHERAANAIVRASGDLHEAARVAQRACAFEPANAKFKVTLANVYLAAGLGLNARRELEAAAQLSPQDDTIQALLKRVAKGGT